MHENPANAEIVAECKDLIESGKPLSLVQSVIFREWLIYVAARRDRLELQSQRKMLSDEKYAELHQCRDELQKYGDYR